MPQTCTAQILVGGHTYGWGQPCRGIGPSHVMYLVEGSRATWVLEEVGHAYIEDPPHAKPVRWVPSGPERIFAEGLLMVALRVEKNDEVVDALAKHLGPAHRALLLTNDYADLTEFDHDALPLLDSTVQKAIESKLVVTVMEESAISGQVSLLEHCEAFTEVCTPSWIRFRGMHGNTQTAGEFPPQDPDAHGFYAIRV